MWITNVSYFCVGNGDYPTPNDNTILIQICDYGLEFPVPKHNFVKTFQYNFADAERDTNDVPIEHKITDEQAQSIVNALQYAQDNQYNVIVHCVAGVCRSGAVTEVGVMMGFNDLKAHRQPNLLVKYKLMKCLGWTYE